MMFRFGLAIAAGLACAAGAQAASLTTRDAAQDTPLIQHVQYDEGYGGYGRRRDEDRDWRRDEWRQRRWREEQARRNEWRRENWGGRHRDYDDDE